MSQTTKHKNPNPLIRYCLYPFLFIMMSCYATLELNHNTEDIGHYYGYYITALVLFLVLIEAIFPLRQQWKMSKNSFFRRDLIYMLIGAASLLLSQYIAGLIIIQYGLTRGEALITMPVIPAVILAILIMDFIWYWVHRLSHEAQCDIGQLMWKIHIAHHLPQQVYVLMHGVAHPINAIIARSIFTLPLFFLGFSVETVFVVNLVVGLQGLVSHFNADIRAGWMNYILVGAELHRYHHSDDPGEAKNYGAVTPVWDLLFGTFVYHPHQPPHRLGINEPDMYPIDRNIIEVMLLPFKKTRRKHQ